MKKFVTVLVAIFAIFVGVLVAGPFFIINEGEQAVVVQFGQIVKVVTDAGLHMKVPVINEVHRFPKKIVTWDGEPLSILTAENQRIIIDVTARWRIINPQAFYETFEKGNFDFALTRLSGIINSAVASVVAVNTLSESVRNSNLILESRTATEGTTAQTIDGTQTSAAHQPITRGRRQLAEEVRDRARRGIESRFGIELIDVVTRQIQYENQLVDSVFARMRSEREQVAQRLTSEGKGLQLEWEGRMEKDKATILSEAYKKSQTIMGEADAEAARIYADAYNQNRAFFDFWRAIESYRNTMQNLDKTLSTDMDYFRFLRTPR
jgi:membrane protease subunit HflC